MEKENIVEVVKANKGKVIKKALIIGGTIAGLAIVLLAASKRGSDEDDLPMDAEEQPTYEADIHEVTEAQE